MCPGGDLDKGRNRQITAKEAATLSESATVKIDFSLIPEHISNRLIADFANNYARFWADPKNEAEFQEWRRKQREGGDEEQA